MYNRYIRNDQGTYTRIPEEPPKQSGTAPPSQPEPETRQQQSSPPPAPGRGKDGLTGFLRHMLDQLHLDSLDTGDLLLLALLFLLFREDADDELLIALGLLLIL